jgi:hypothetical protein
MVLRLVALRFHAWFLGRGAFDATLALVASETEV